MHLKLKSDAVVTPGKGGDLHSLRRHHCGWNPLAKETHQLDISIDTLAAAANSIATHQSAAASPNVIDSGNFSTSKHMGTTEFDECESKKKKINCKGLYIMLTRGAALCFQGIPSCMFIGK